MRDIRPKQEPDCETPANLGGLQQAPSIVPNKRKCISSACLPCRKRKSKCDGGLPVCSTCTAVYHTECNYDVDSDHRRKAALKRDIQALKEENGALAVIIRSIKSRSEAAAHEIVHQLRTNEDLESIAESLKKPDISHEPTDSGVENDLKKRGRASTDARGRTKWFGATSNLGFVPEDYPLAMTSSSEMWTQVTEDMTLVKQLFDLYFCWIHPVFQFFSKPAFFDDFRHGRNNYCSSLLVNAILANASHLSDRTDLRRNPKDPRTAGEDFYDEAKRLLESEESSLTTVQALAILGQREPSCGRESSGYAYSGRAARMAIELGLHITLQSDGRMPGPTEVEVRRITFWGVFITETLWSACVGRQTPLPTAAIKVERPAIVPEYDAAAWLPCTDHGHQAIDYEQHQNIGLLTDALISFCHIVSDMLTAFYAPKERFTSRKLLEFYRRFTSWYENLDDGLKLQKVTTPHVLSLHMLYHCMLTMMCRAFFDLDLVRSDFVPRRVCYDSANQIARLWSVFRRTYSVRRTCIITSHISLSAAIMDLKYLPYPRAASNLAQGIYIMREAFPNHGFQQRNLNIILALSKQWKIILPQEVLTAAHALTSDTGVALISFPSNHANDTWPPTDGAGPIDDLAQSHQDLTLHGGLSQPEIDHYVNIHHNTKLHPPQVLPVSPFWSPFPTQSLPLQAEPPSQGPMALNYMMMNNDMVGQPQSDSWEQLTKDGFAPATPSLSDSYLPPQLPPEQLNGEEVWHINGKGPNGQRHG